MSTGKVLLGVLAGVAVGALAGILFAPDKGSNTRKKISRKGDDYADAIKVKFNEFLESISEKSEELEDEFSATKKNISKKGDEYLLALKDKFNEFLESISEESEAVEEEVRDFANQGNDKIEKAKKAVRTITN